MLRRLHNSIFKLFLTHPFQPSAKPACPFLLTAAPTQLKSLHPFAYPFPHNPHIPSAVHQTLRAMTTESGGHSVPDLDVNKEVDMINLKFADAREELQMAMESKETVYFDEEAACAKAAVKEVLDRFQGLLQKLPESEKAALQRSMGLKIQQLKAELEQLDD